MPARSSGQSVFGVESGVGVTFKTKLTMRETFYLDLTGLTYPDALALQERMLENGISSSISTGSLFVHAPPEVFIEAFPEMKDRILNQGETPYGLQMRDAFRAEGY